MPPPINIYIFVISFALMKKILSIFRVFFKRKAENADGKRDITGERARVFFEPPCGSEPMQKVHQRKRKFSFKVAKPAPNATASFPQENSEAVSNTATKCDGECETGFHSGKRHRVILGRSCVIVGRIVGRSCVIANPAGVKQSTQIVDCFAAKCGSQ